MPRSRDRAETGRASASRLPILIAVGLAVLVLAVYWGSGTHSFVNFDDGEYVYENPHIAGGLTAAGIRWAFTAFYAANWHPVTWLSHMVDVQLFGMNAGWHHRVNVFLHVINTVFLFMVLRRLTGAVWRSAFAAALFGIHPLHVESVAWVSERKDVLSTFFLLLTIAAYAAWVRDRRRWTLAAAFAACALGLMAKPMLVTIPVLLLLVDFWPLRRFDRERTTESMRAILLEKVPFLALAIAAAAATWLAQLRAGAMAMVATFAPAQRAANTFVSYVLYLRDTVWPAGLAVFYPHPSTIGERVPTAAWIGAAAILASLTALVVRERKRRPYLLFGWLWFLGTLLPVIGIIQVGSQAMADRYTYIPLIGIFVAVSWGAAELIERFRCPRSVRIALWVACLAPLSFAAHARSNDWVDGFHLYRHAIAVTRKNWLAWNNLGMQFLAAGDDGQAAVSFHEAVSIKPDYSVGWYNLGVASGKLGRHAEAAGCYRRALDLDAANADGWVNLSFEYQAVGNLDAAVAAAGKALRIRPKDPAALESLVISQWGRGDLAAAKLALGRLYAVDPAAAAALGARLSSSAH